MLMILVKQFKMRYKLIEHRLLQLKYTVEKGHSYPKFGELLNEKNYIRN